jgi:hypothetical protein
VDKDHKSYHKNNRHVWNAATNAHNSHKADRLPFCGKGAVVRAVVTNSPSSADSFPPISAHTHVHSLAFRTTPFPRWSYQVVAYSA